LITDSIINNLVIIDEIVILESKLMITSSFSKNQLEAILKKASLKIGGRSKEIVTESPSRLANNTSVISKANVEEVIKPNTDLSMVNVRFVQMYEKGEGGGITEGAIIK